jgi:putative ABC transport system permease protein
MIWILIIIIMAVSFGLLNTILMSILERSRELGVLLAVGMKRSKVFSMIVAETTIIALIGGIIGLSMSWGMIRLLGNTGVPIPGGEGLEDFGYASVLYPRLETAFYFEIAIVLVIFAILASVYPAWKAIRLQPAEAVRQE